jgi:hypothetical protein
MISRYHARGVVAMQTGIPGSLRRGWGLVQQAAGADLSAEIRQVASLLLHSEVNIFFRRESRKVMNLKDVTCRYLENEIYHVIGEGDKETCSNTR